MKDHSITVRVLALPFDLLTEQKEIRCNKLEEARMLW